MLGLWAGLVQCIKIPPQIQRFLQSRSGDLLLAALAVGVYATTLRCGFVQDDVIALSKHPEVRRGAAGIPALLTSDAYAYMGGGSADSQARYRPLSFVTYALETQVFGARPWLHKSVNILLFAATVLCLRALLRRWLPGRDGFAWLVAALFAVHPLHAEAVANIKGRDEVLSLLAMLLVCLLAWRRGWRAWMAAPLALLFLAALLSKEYGLMLLVLVPMVWRLRPLPGRQRIAITIGLALGLAAYAALRVSAVGLGAGDLDTKRTHDPYQGVAWADSLPTKLALLAQHPLKTVWPWPPRYDYQFAQFPLRTWTTPTVWLSVLFWSALAVAAAWWWWLRRPSAIPALWTLGAVLPVSNLLLEIGTPYNERLSYHASVGLIWLLLAALARLPWRPPILLAVVGVVGLAAGAATLRRGWEWRTEASLFIADLPRAPFSPVVQSNAAAMYMDRYDWTNALACLDRAIDMEPDFADAHINRAFVQEALGDLGAASADLDRAFELWPGHPKQEESEQTLGKLFWDRGRSAGLAGDAVFAVDALALARRWLGDQPALVYEIGGALHEAGRTADAIPLWLKCRRIDPERFGAWKGFDQLPPLEW